MSDVRMKPWTRSGRISTKKKRTCRTWQEKKIDEDFKRMIVELYRTGTTVEQLASKYGLASQTIYRWINLYTPGKETGVTEAEMNQMKKDMAKLQEENAILKKALTIFAQK